MIAMHVLSPSLIIIGAQTNYVSTAPDSTCYACLLVSYPNPSAREQVHWWYKLAVISTGATKGAIELKAENDIPLTTTNWTCV